MNPSNDILVIPTNYVPLAINPLFLIIRSIVNTMMGERNIVEIFWVSMSY